MIPNVKRGVSVVRARNSTLPTRWPSPGGTTIGWGSTGPIPSRHPRVRDANGGQRLLEAGARSGGRVGVRARRAQEDGGRGGPARRTLDHRSVAAARRDHPVGLQLAIGARDGAAGDAEVVRELADRGQAVAWRERFREHERGDLLAQLLVRRDRRARVDRERHAGVAPAARAGRRTRQAPLLIPEYANSDATRQTTAGTSIVARSAETSDACKTSEMPARESSRSASPAPAAARIDWARRASSAATSPGSTNGCGRRTIQRSAVSRPAARPTIAAAITISAPLLGFAIAAGNGTAATASVPMAPAAAAARCATTTGRGR